MITFQVDDKGLKDLASLIKAIPAENLKSYLLPRQHNEARKQFQRVFTVLDRWERTGMSGGTYRQMDPHSKVGLWWKDAKELLHPSTDTASGDYENDVVIENPDTDATKKAIQSLVKRAIDMPGGFITETHSWCLIKETAND